MTDRSQQRERFIQAYCKTADLSPDYVDALIDDGTTKAGLMWLGYQLAFQPAVAGAVDEDVLIVIARKIRDSFGRPDSDGRFWKWDELPESNRLHWLSHARDVVALVRTASPSQPAAGDGLAKELADQLEALELAAAPKADKGIDLDACEALGEFYAANTRHIIAALRASPADDGEMIGLMQMTAAAQRKATKPTLGLNNVASVVFKAVDYPAVLAEFRQQNKQP